MPLNLADAYAAQISDRTEYLEAAQDVAEQTLIHLKPKGEKVDQSKVPYSHEGAKDVRSLASSLFKTMMPSGVTWGQLNLSEEDWAKLSILEEDGEVPEGTERVFRQRLRKRSGEVVRSLEQKLSRSRGAKAIRRNIVEGNTLLVNRYSGLSVYPLRSIVTDRQSGHLRSMVLKEEMVPDPIEDLGNDASPPDDKKENVYTLVRYPYPNPLTGETVDKGGVWRQSGDKGTPKKIKDAHEQYVCFVSEVPEIDHYAYGYAFDFMRLFAQINHAEKSLGQAMTAAAYNRPLVREGSTAALAWDEFIDGEAGKPWIGNEDDFSWFTSGVKINEWGFLAGMLERLASDAQSAFAVGLKDRRISSDTSATAILQMVDELDTQVEDLHTAYEETLQRPLFLSELYLIEQVDPLITEALIQSVPAEFIQGIEVEVTTGVSVLTKQQALLKFITMALPNLVQLDPMRFLVNAGPIAEEYSSALPFKTTNFWSWNPRMPQQPAPGAESQNGESAQPPREDTIMTAGGPQPPQPEQGAPPLPGGP